MASGIVSLGAHQAGLEVLSSVLLWITAALYITLMVFHATRFVRRPRVVLSELRTSAIFEYLTSVAAGSVLGSALLLAGVGNAPAWALFIVSGLLWVAITLAVGVELVVIRSLHLRSEVQGGWLLAVVAPQALSVLALSLGHGSGADALTVTAFSLWLLASASYTPIAVARLRRLEGGRRPWAALRAEDWILMGALAISTLAGSDLVDRLAHHGAPLGSVRPFLQGAVAVQFAVACVLIALLLWGELRHATTSSRARRGIPSATRWASVFPLGMFAVASHTFASSAHLPAMGILGNLFFAIAFAAWLATATASVRERLGDLRPATGTVRAPAAARCG